MTVDKGYLTASLNFMVGGDLKDLEVIKKHAAAHPGCNAAKYVEKVSTPGAKTPGF